MNTLKTESPSVPFTWHASQYKVNEIHQNDFLISYIKAINNRKNNNKDNNKDNNNNNNSKNN